VKDLFGLRMGDVPAEFFAKWRSFAEHAASANLDAVGVAAIALAIILVWPYVSRRIPGAFVALIVTSVGVAALHLPVETIGSRFGRLPSTLHAPTLPHVDLAVARSLVGPAFTIALLAAVESLLSAIVSDGMIGGRHRSNMELVAQGVANIASPLFGGIPATGAIARTATNVKNGGRTPVAGIVHALTLLLIMLFFGRWAAYIPFATLAAILTVVAYHMSEWRAFKGELRAPRSDALVMIVTFVLTVVVDLTVAMEVGMVLAAFLFMKRMSEVAHVKEISREFRDDVVGDEEETLTSGYAIPKGVTVFEINGPFFFGAAQTFREHVESVLGLPRVLILRMRNVPAIDSTAMHALREVVRRARRDRTLVLLAEVGAEARLALARSETMRDVGEENVFPTLELALEAAHRQLATDAGSPDRQTGPELTVRHLSGSA
jgi:SulP family sulfate permease